MFQSNLCKGLFNLAVPIMLLVFMILPEVSGQVEEGLKDKAPRIILENRQNWELGKIEPDLTKVAQKLEQVNIIIFLENQPITRIVGDVRVNYDSAIEQIEKRIQSINQDIRERSKYETREEEISWQKTAPKLSPGQRQALRSELENYDQLAQLMRGEVANRVRQATELEQNILKSYIEANGGTVTHTLLTVNAISAIVPSSSLKDIANQSGIDKIVMDRILEGNLDVSAASIFANTWWTNGYDGGVWDYGVIDSGIDDTHPALSSHSFFEGRFLVTADANVPGLPGNDPTADDVNGHGTHVAGIGASTNTTYQGIAFGHDRLINGKAGYDADGNDGGNAYMYWSDKMDAVDWAIFTPGADVLNLSYGGSVSVDYTDPARFWDAVVADLFIPATISAGNDGPGSMTVGEPAIAANIICVANMQDMGTTSRSDDIIRNSSSRGPTVGGRKKPDLTAPGTFISSTNNNWESVNPDFVSMTGTSMAAPHVAGSLLLLMDEGNLNPMAQKGVLINTAESGSWVTEPSGWNDTYGWGYIDLDHAYFHRGDYFLESVTAQGTPDDKDYYLGSAFSGDKATLVWNKHTDYNGSDFPTVYYDLNDIDLSAYVENSSSFLDGSFDGNDNVEQVQFAASNTVVLKVESWSTTFQGVTLENYALATEENFVKVVPPNIAITPSVTNPSTVPLGGIVTLSYDFENTGQLTAHNVDVDIILPAGLGLVSGPTADLFDLPPAGVQTVSWDVQGASLGVHNMDITGFSSSYGESFSRTITDNLEVVSGTVGPIVFFDYTIDDDNLGNSSGNGDGIINPGETVELYVDLENLGTGSATAVNACISESSPYVSGFLFNTCSSYGDILGGGTAINTDDFDFPVDPGTPDGHLINFAYNITASNGGPWAVNFSIPVVAPAPDISVNPPTLTFTAPVGGTDIQTLTIDNAGIVDLFWNVGESNWPGTIITRSANNAIDHLKMNDSELRFEDITGPPFFRNTFMKLAEGLGFPFNSLNNSSQNSLTESVIFFDDMESGVGGWTTMLIGGAVDDLWHQTAVNANSPVTSWWCADGISGNYDTGNRINTILVSPLIDLTGATAPVTLEFYENFDTEFGWDYCMVDVSTDGGASWFHLRGSSGFDTAPSGNSGGWILSGLDLTPYIGQQIKLGFYFDTIDAVANAFPGWFIDDVLVFDNGVTDVVPWLSENPSNGTVPPAGSQNVDVTADAAGVPVGTYHASVVINNNDLNKNPVTIPVEFNVISINPPDIDVAPSSLSFTVPFGGTANDLLTISNTAAPGSDALNWSITEIELPLPPLDLSAGEVLPLQIQPLTTSSYDIKRPSLQLQPNKGESYLRYEKQVMDGTQMMSSPGKLSTKPQPDNSSSVNEAINSIISRSGILNSPIVLEKSEPATGSRDHSKRIELKRPEQVANTKYDLSSRSVADVVILGSPFDANWNTDVQDKLLSTGLFSSVSVVNIATVTPTLAELQAFDAALVYSDGPGYNDPVLFGDNLADYVDGGGGVVCAVFSTASIPFAGRFDTDNYWAIAPSGQTGGQEFLGTIYDPTHPILNNVVSFDGGSSSFRQSTTSIASGATRIADWTDGTALIATKVISGINRADLGFFPPSSDSRSDFWNSATDGAKMMANALLYVAGVNTDCPWISENPTLGSVAPGGSQNVNIMVDATGLPFGSYHCNLLISSNDPDENPVTVPVTLNVVPPSVAEFGVVTNVGDRTIHIIDVANNALFGPFLGGSLGTGQLLDPVITPDGQTALVSNFSDHTVFFVDVSNPLAPSVIGSVNIGFSAEDIALTSNGAYALVTDGSLQPTLVAVIDVVSMSLIQTMDITPRQAQAVEIGPNGTVILANYSADQIHVMTINSTTGVLTDLGITHNVGDGPLNVAISPDGQTGLVANIHGSTVSVLHITGPGAVSVSSTIPNIMGPQSIAFRPDGLRAFAVETGASPDDLAILSVNAPGNVTDTGLRIGLLSNVGPGSGFFGVDVLDVSSDGSTAYVGNPMSGPGTVNDVAAVDLNNLALADTLPAGNIPVGVALAGGAGEVVASVICPPSVPQNCPFTAEIKVDMSGMSAPDTLLGSFTATLTYDNTCLDYTGDSGILSGFTGAINVDETNGIITFNGANPFGASGLVDIFNVDFDVIGAVGDSCCLDLEFSAMAAALTFNDLLPFLNVNDCCFVITQSGLLGDVNGDGFVNSTDALIVLSYDAGIPIPPQFEDRINAGFGDVNGDGLTNSTDALIILSYDVGIPVPFPVGQPFCP